MLNNDDTPGRLERVITWLPEAFYLRTLLATMMLATGVVVTMDLREMLDAEGVSWSDPRLGTPGPMTLPKPSDHIRPYLPRSRPLTRDGGKPKLPGLPADYDEAALVQKRLAFFLGEKGRASAIGRIEPGAAKDFERFLMENKGKVRSLALHSPGGSVQDALALGKLLRADKINTHVPTNGYCASSCPLVFAGGAKRTAGQKAWIGVHQVYTSASAIGTIHDGLAEAQRISATCQQYLTDMGVEAEVWTHAMRTPKHQLYFLTPEQLVTLKLATRVAGFPEKPVRKRRRKRKT